MIIDYDKEPSKVTIVGTDNYVPVYQPEALWRIWSIDDLYLGKEGKNKHIPKLKDYVVSPFTGDLYMVVGRDPITWVPKLKPHSFNFNMNSDIIINNVDQGFRIYYDTSQTPYTLTLDQFVKFLPLEATTARIYRGVVIEENGGVSPDNDIVSRIYNNSGDFVGHDIPLQRDVINSHDNCEMKIIPTCNTNADLKDGEMLSVVIFNARGKVLSKIQAVVDNTTYIPHSYTTGRYITDIKLRSTFLDEVDGNTLRFPANLTMDSLNPIGVVCYNDGTEEEYIVDGRKFDLHGLNPADNDGYNGKLVNSFAATTIGHKVPVVLTYRMELDESTIMSTGYNPQIISKKYELIVVEPNRSYGVKLFAYPKWAGDLVGYELEFYLLNLDRDVIYPVTPLVSLAKNSKPFMPTAYGMTQILTYQLDLAGVSTSFQTFLHSQTIEIVLRAPANQEHQENIWEVSTQYPSDTPFFGSGLSAKLTNENKIVNIGNGIETLKEWLDKVYYTTDPLVDPESELSPPAPTHVMLRYRNETKLIKISEYAHDIEFDRELTMYDNIDLIFYKEVASAYLHLSVACLTLRKK